ncbi:MAG TPA: aromatic ring-hydroxylating dioxygenase subunit alpha [Rhizomicrobium sp.]|nr:aromatic ring-hydroxylating dioxygenase subunit alpha [Rhizomicrobium sp.]
MLDASLDDKFFRGLDSSTGEVTKADTLPPLAYTSEQFYEFEKKAIFFREWLCVGRTAWVKEPGDYFTSMHAGEPIIVARNRSGELKAFSSVCQHRAMLVAENFGKARSFVCPYHHWTYSLDGELVGAPAMEQTCNFSKSDVRLPQFKLEVWLGFIFINFDLAAAPLAPRLSALTKMLANYDIETGDEPSTPEPGVKCPWNWKVQLENSNDGYHANRLHQGPVHDMCPSDMATFPGDLPQDTAGYYRFNETVDIDIGFNPTKKAILPIFPRLTMDERRRFVFANVPPTLQIFCRPDWASFTIFHAEGPEQVSFERNWMVAPGASKEALFKERMDIYFATSAVHGVQDRHVDELVQIGLRSRYAIRGRYSYQERAQLDLNNWLVPRYQDYWEKLQAGA